MFINPDLTLYIERRAGGRVDLPARRGRSSAAGGVGIAESVLYDARGRVGRAIQALLVAPR